VLHPIRRSQQHNTGGLHEEHAKVAVAALGDAPEDRSITSGHLLRNQTEPGSKITPTCEGRSIADRRDNGARDDGPSKGSLARSNFARTPIMSAGCTSSLTPYVPSAASFPGCSPPSHCGSDALGVATLVAVLCFDAVAKDNGARISTIKPSSAIAPDPRAGSQVVTKVATFPPFVVKRNPTLPERSAV
jgi:hypothetical protein